MLKVMTRAKYLFVLGRCAYYSSNNLVFQRKSNNFIEKCLEDEEKSGFLEHLVLEWGYMDAKIKEFFIAYQK